MKYESIHHTLSNAVTSSLKVAYFASFTIKQLYV